MLTRAKSFINENPVTPILLTLMTLILIVQVYVAAYSVSLFEFVFVGQDSVTPGLLLAPISHATLWTHLFPNMVLLLMVGWSLEDYLDTSRFVLFTAASAYVPTYIQIVYSTVTTGTAGTLGFSGAVYAFPPTLLCLSLRDSDRTNLGTIGSLALGLTVAIPLQLSGLLGSLISSPLPGADMTHSAGYLMGWAYGLFLLSEDYR
jgi:membrane associated rhomboid family serine protease